MAQENEKTLQKRIEGLAQQELSGLFIKVTAVDATVGRASAWT